MKGGDSNGKTSKVTRNLSGLIKTIYLSHCFKERGVKKNETL